MTTVAPNTRTRTSFVYSFDQTPPGGRELLGGKGLGLSEMAHLGVPVPEGFTITTDACRAFLTSGDLDRRGARPARTPATRWTAIMASEDRPY